MNRRDDNSTWENKRGPAKNAAPVNETSEAEKIEEENMCLGMGTMNGPKQSGGGATKKKNKKDDDDDHTEKKATTRTIKSKACPGYVFCFVRSFVWCIFLLTEFCARIKSIWIFNPYVNI